MKTSKSDDILYLKHILESISKVERFVSYEDSEEFKDDELIQDAIVRNLQTMSESTQKLSESLKLTVSDIPWHSLSGFRNVLVHDYLGIDMDEIYQTIKSDLPKLKKRILQMLEYVNNKNNL